MSKKVAKKSANAIDKSVPTKKLHRSFVSFFLMLYIILTLTDKTC